MDNKKVEQRIDDSESQNSDLEVRIAKPGDLTEEDIADCAESLIEKTFDKLNVPAEEIRMRIKDSIQVIRNKLGKAFPGSKSFANLVYPGYTHKEFIEGYTNRIQNLLNSGELMIGKSNGRVVGIIGFYKCPDFEGREVYGTTKGTVLKEFSGKGFYSKIKNAAMENLREAHPNSPIITITKNNKIIEHMKKYYPVTEEIPLDSEHPLSRNMKKDIGEPEFSKMVREDNVILWYDPKNI